MKREIKFRAWDKEAGYFRPITEDPDYIVVFSGNNDGMQLWNNGNSIPVDRIVWQQFVGLKDDAGEEMYDGDIVMFIDGSRAAIEWNDDTCQYQFSDGTPINSGSRYGSYKRIIGNIFETPELITSL